MKKAFTNKSDIKKFKNGYSNGDIETEVITNLYNLSDKYSKLDQLFQFNLNSGVLQLLIPHHGEAALTKEFGKYDFKFSGNRMYHNWILEHDGLIFVAPSKREVILDKINEEFINKVVEFEQSYMQLVVDYCYQADLNPLFKEGLTDLENKGFIKDKKLNFDFKPTKSLRISV